jgi:hypothetical protein
VVKGQIDCEPEGSLGAHFKRWPAV